MLKKTLFLVFLVIALTFSVSAQNRKTLILPKSPQPLPDPPPGNIQLLDGYTHVRKQGYDTSVGEIRKFDGMMIHYDNGRLAGIMASKCWAKNACLWYKAQKLGDREVYLGLTKEGQIIATFPKEFANFYAQTKSPEEIADFLIMILTYKLKENTKAQTKIEIRQPQQ